MKKTTRIAALLTAAVLIFGGLFYSCSDPADGTGGGTGGNLNGNSGGNGSNGGNGSGSDGNSTDDGAPNPALPASVGENPVTAAAGGTASAAREIKLIEDDDIGDDNPDYLVLKTDGTAEYHNAWSKGDEIEYTYKYTWNTQKQEIYMTVEKLQVTPEDTTLYTYSEAIKNLEQILLANEKYEYNAEKKDDADFAKNYPTFEDYKKHLVESGGYNSFDEYLAEYKESVTGALNVLFGATITYGYEINGGKMTLAEKFTGIENLETNSYFSHRESETTEDGDVRIGIDIEFEIWNTNVFYNYYYRYSAKHYSDAGSWWSTESKSADYDGEINSENKTIAFELNYKNPDSAEFPEKFSASYTEDFAAETVTVIIGGKNYVCELYRKKTFTQTD
ncbi:MAG: hypothetical protein NC041_05490 [Bacteroides sp.]|nr:hypothetical protein [Prevotella sp.]MCM1407410.1 hypothetical protein [Treponema brennaborense]MCM1469900.1 hypothetical protein [Bacteroides sp.]